MSFDPTKLEDELKRLEALAALATPGEWTWEAFTDFNGMLHGPAETLDQALYMKNVDAALIVAARNALPRLIAALREAREDCDELLETTGALTGDLLATLEQRDAALKERDAGDNAVKRWAATCCKLSLEADALRAEVERLTGLIKPMGRMWDHRDEMTCRWCELEDGDDESLPLHSPDCPAFTPDGTVRRGEGT